MFCRLRLNYFHEMEPYDIDSSFWESCDYFNFIHTSSIVFAANIPESSIIPDTKSSFVLLTPSTCTLVTFACRSII